MLSFQHGDKYHVYENGYDCPIPMSKSSAVSYWNKSEEGSDFDYDTVCDYKCTVDYNSKTGLNIVNKRAEFVLNPSELWTNTEDYDKEIAEAYNKLYDNKLADIIHLIGLTVVYKENKKRNLLLTACSGKGKSGLFELLGCVDVTAESFMSSLVSTNGGMAKSEIAKIKKTGLVVLDEVDAAIPAEFKNTTGTIQLRTMFEGKVAVPIVFIAMTSTTSSSLWSLDSQLTNRMMHVDIDNTDTITDIGYEIDDYFTEQTQRYVRHLFLEGMKMDRAELERLQELFSVKESVNMYNENEEIGLKAIYNQFALTTDGNATTMRKLVFKKMAMKHLKAAGLEDTNTKEVTSNLLKAIYTGKRNMVGSAFIFTNWEEQFGLITEPTGMVFNEEAAMKEINHD